MGILENVDERAESAEVYESEVKSVPVKFTSGELDYVKSFHSKGIALRVLEGGRIGYSTTTNPEEEEDLIERAMESSQYGDQASFEFPRSRDVSEVDAYDPLVEEFGLQEAIDLGYDFLREIEDSYPQVKVDMTVNRTVGDVRVKNTSGLDRRESRTLLGVSVNVQRVEGDDIFNFWKELRSRRKEVVDVDFLIDEVKNKLRWAEKIEEIDSGPQPVVFTPSGALVLILPLIAGLNGQNRYLGTSPISDKKGGKIFDDGFTLVDNGRRIESVRGGSFDDEGYPTSKDLLIDGGELKGFVYDQRAAGLSGEEPTGNGFKGGLRGGGDFRAPPESGPSSWIIERGKENLGKIIKDVQNGLLVDGVLGLGQGNVLSGEFSNNVSVAYKIEDGLIKGRVKNTMIAGNVYDLLKSKLIDIGQNPEWVFGSLRIPPIAVDEVHVVQK